MGLYANIYKAFSLPSVASFTCVCACLAIDLVRGPRRSSSMDSLPPSRPRRSPWSWSRRSPWLVPWLLWVGVLGPPPSRLPSLLPAMGPAQHAYIIACCHVITSDYQGGTEYNHSHDDTRGRSSAQDADSRRSTHHFWWLFRRRTHCLSTKEICEVSEFSC